MSSDADKTVDFVLVRTMTPRQVVCILLDRFPTMRDLICPDEYCFDEPTRVYDSFAGIVIDRSDDPGFIQSVVMFIDELSESRDPLIQDMLSSALLEGIAVNPRVSRIISRTLTPHSRSILNELEMKIFGREPSGETASDRDN